MDALTHLALPLAIAVALRPGLFPDARTLALGVVGLLPDLDKVIGMPGLFHSLVTLVPVSVAVLALSRTSDRRFRYGLLVVALLASHILLDLVDGGPVPPLYPFIETGFGFLYPGRLVIEGPLDVTLDGPLVTLRTRAPRTECIVYTPLDSTGVASVLILAVVLRFADR